MLAGVVLLSSIGCGVDSHAPTFQLRAVRFSGSEWFEPVNLGSTINTTFNEQGPSLSNDELSLYFGSDRPGGFGGFDIWVSRRDCTDGPWEAPVTSTRRSVHDPWSTPVNLGLPLNSPASEQQPSLSGDGRTLVFASSRSGGFGGTDIWISTRTSSGKEVP